MKWIRKQFPKRGSINWVFKKLKPMIKESFNFFITLPKGKYYENISLHEKIFIDVLYDESEKK